VEGKIRNEQLQVEVETKCSHCGRMMHLSVDSDLRMAVHEEGAAPWVFMPDMDWEHFTERTIIDAY
jgi:hypothetical protein